MNILIINGAISIIPQLEQVRKFKGVIVATDVTTNLLCQNMIPFQYVITREDTMDLNILPGKHLAPIKDKYILVHSYRQQFKPHIWNHLKKVCDNLQLYVPKLGGPHDPQWINNVGLMALAFVTDKLAYDRMILIGYDHRGSNVYGHLYQEKTYKEWIKALKFFKAHYGISNVVNCSANTIIRSRIIQQGKLEEYL